MKTKSLFQYPLIFIMVLLSIGCSSTNYIEIESKNYDTRVKYIVLHFTSEDINESLRLLTANSSRSVSSHYLISDRQQSQNSSKPKVYKLVDEEFRAWHAGSSFWDGERGINDNSIGIEIVNESKCSVPVVYLENYSDINTKCKFEIYPEEQIEELIKLIKSIKKRHPKIKSKNIIGHSDIAPKRKIDPGPLFPWKQLFDVGIGAWYSDEIYQSFLRNFSDKMPTVKEVQEQLFRYGYDIKISGYEDKQSRDNVRAFQLHFRPSKYDGYIDAETAAIIFSLNKIYK